MIKILVTAPRGKMASLIIKEVAKNKDIRVIGALGPKGRPYIGQDVGLVSGMNEALGVEVYDDIDEIIDECDVVVDYSTVDLSDEVLKACIKHKKALLCGTTGLPKKMDDKMREASKDIPIIEAANTSYMVNVMTKLLAIAANSLCTKCKIDVIDMHDEQKVDAPSGTAIEFAEAMSRASGIPEKDIECHSIRSGDIPSSHTIVFGGMGERMEISHHAYNWMCYAKGACDAIRFISEKHKGFYGMEDVIA